ncbi:hypothetical protein BJX65DRAFT_309036 [Aspergillus insuetus]
MLWFGFDIMGELGFGRSFGTLKEAKLSAIVHLVEIGARAINMMGNVAYVSYILRFLPSPLKKFEISLEEALNWRMAKADYDPLFSGGSEGCRHWGSFPGLGTMAPESLLHWVPLDHKSR